MDEPPESEDVYRAVIGPDHEFLTKELKLLTLLADEVDALLPAGLSIGERVSRAQEIVSGDPALSGLAAELMALAEERHEPALWQRLAEAEDIP